MLQDMINELGRERIVDNTMLSREIIKPQVNDWVVPAIENMFKKIRDEVINMGSGKQAAYFKNKNIKKYYSEIDRLAKDRFGITIAHAYAPTVYAVYTVAPKNSLNTLRLFNLEIVRGIEKAAKDTNTDIVDLTKEDDYRQAMDKMTKANKALEKALNSNGVIID